MIENLTKILPKEIIEYYNFIYSFKSSKDIWEYRFISNEEFLEIDDPNGMAKIYWLEMLYRTHIVVLVSWFKALRWLDSLDNNINNYYGFCSNLRSLVESCADSFYTLRSAPLTIAKDYRAIYESINNNNSPIILFHKPLEETLLHFIQGTKLSKEEKKSYPAEYNAKHIVEYLSSIEGGNEEITQLYSYLCGISHPAYESTQMFLFLHNEDTIVCGDSYDFEKKQVEELAEIFGDSLSKMFNVFMANTFSTLNLLNYFQIPEIHSENIADKIEWHSSWVEIAKYMDESHKLYLQALEKENYE
jgi:hypothetical protein